MKINIALVILLLICTDSLYAQTLNVGGNGKALQVTKSTAYSGSPYFNETPVKSKLITNSGKSLEVNQLRYDLSNQQVEYIDKDVVYAIQDSLTSFSLPDTAGKIHEFKKADGKFLELLVDGKIKLLKYYAAKTASTEDWYTKKLTKTMVHEESYYSSKDGKIEKLNPSAKNLGNLFSDQQASIKAFIKDQDLDLKKDQGLIALFQYYNTLK